MENPKKKRKTDRRTLYTLSVIKDAFLELMTQMPFARISVTRICQQAELSRATFYLHFDNVDEVLDSVIDDALLLSEQANGTVIDMMDVIGQGSPDALKNNEAVLPACQRIADSERYHQLFMDPFISDHIIKRIARHERSAVIPSLMERGNLTEEEAEAIFRFILYGSFAVNRSLGWQKNSRWFRYQDLMGKFINGGMLSV